MLLTGHLQMTILDDWASHDAAEETLRHSHHAAPPLVAWIGLVTIGCAIACAEVGASATAHLLAFTPQPQLLDVTMTPEAALDEFEAEAALADSWIGNDADDLTAALKCPVQRTLEHRHLTAPPDELREPPRTRDLEVCLQAADPLKLVDAERFLHPLDRKLPEVLKAANPSTSFAVCSLR